MKYQIQDYLGAVLYETDNKDDILAFYGSDSIWNSIEIAAKRGGSYKGLYVVIDNKFKKRPSFVHGFGFLREPIRILGKPEQISNYPGTNGPKIFYAKIQSIHDFLMYQDWICNTLTD